MKVTPTDLEGVLLIEPRVHRDDRGFFFESYHEQRYRDAGIDVRFVQDNHSRSEGSVLRGLHLQRRHRQGKLVRVSHGEIFDVAVDIRPASPTFRRWVGVRLSADNALQLYIPPGLAHGFCTLSPVTEVQYKCTDYYHPEDEITLAWNDPGLAIEWPARQPQLSDKDRRGRTLEEVVELIAADER